MHMYLKQKLQIHEIKTDRIEIRISSLRIIFRDFNIPL